MKIGELAQVARCTVETVRYYEKAGLLPAPARTAAHYRRYGAAQVERLRFIRNCRALGMTHVEIRALLGWMDQPADPCGGVNQLLDQHIDHVDARIEELRQLKQQLATLRARCRSERAVEACGIVHGLVEMTTEPPHDRHTHLG